MAAPRHSGRSRFPLAILLLISVTLLTLDARDFGPVERLKDGVAAVMSPFRSLGDTVFGPVGDAWTSIGEADDLREENEQLRQQVEDLEALTIADVGAAEELEELRRLVGLDAAIGFTTVTAEVTAGSVSNFDPFVLEINRGSSNGVAENQPVLSGQSLVGRVDEARRGSARVRLLSDPDVGVGVQVVGKDEVGILRGQGEGELLIVDAGIEVGADVEVGDLIVTSGLGRSLYPENLAIGTVVEVRVDEVNLELDLLVQPTASLERFTFVSVVQFDADAVIADDTEDDADAEEDGG